MRLHVELTRINQIRFAYILQQKLHSQVEMAAAILYTVLSAVTRDYCAMLRSLIQYKHMGDICNPVCSVLEELHPASTGRVISRHNEELSSMGMLYGT